VQQETPQQRIIRKIMEQGKDCKRGGGTYSVKYQGGKKPQGRWGGGDSEKFMCKYWGGSKKWKERLMCRSVELIV